MTAGGRLLDAGRTLLMGVLNALVLLPMQYIPISTTCFLLPCLVMLATMLAFNFRVVED